MQTEILYARQFLFLLVALTFIQCKSSNKSQTEKPINVNPLALHRTVAIIPANVNVSLNTKGKEQISDESFVSIKETSAYSMQEKFYNLLVLYAKNREYYISCQSIYTTNSKLKAAGIQYKDLYTTDRSHLAKILGVDAIIQLSTSSEQFMSDGAAIARSLLLMSSKNKQASVSISIADGKSGNTCWSYEGSTKGSSSKSSASLVDATLRACAARIPYKKRMLKENGQVI